MLDRVDAVLAPRLEEADEDLPCRPVLIAMVLVDLIERRERFFKQIATVRLDLC